VDSLQKRCYQIPGNNKDPDYVTIVANMLEKFKVLGCLMNLKINFLHSHLDFFPKHLGAVSEEQGELFHQDIKEMDRRYQGRLNAGRYIAKIRKPHIQKSNIRGFAGKRKRQYKVN
jgi:hypothetical protein